MLPMPVAGADCTSPAPSSRLLTLPDVAALERLLREHGCDARFSRRKGDYTASLDEWRFRSRFRALHVLTGGGSLPCGYEAVARAGDVHGSAFPVGVLFAVEVSARRCVQLDRLLRTLHALNFRAAALQGRLHLKVNARHLLGLPSGHGLFFAQALSLIGLMPRNVCLEVILDGDGDRMALLAALGGYRAQGFGIALGGFGSGREDLMAAWLLQPDIIKLDPGLMRRALMQPDLRDTLCELVPVLHQHGARVLAGGVDCARQADIARLAGCDFAQGRHFDGVMATNHSA